jgi:hypothetical protein
MRYCILLYLFLFLSGEIAAQDTTSSAGGNILSSDGSSISYTLGQTAYTTIANAERSFAEGIQQTYALKVTPINPGGETEGASIDCIVYPNPTSNNVTINIKNADPTAFKYLLYTSNRRLIKQNNILSSSTILSMVDLPSGAYLLKISNSKRNITRIFKIIKDNTLQ